MVANNICKRGPFSTFSHVVPIQPTPERHTDFSPVHVELAALTARDGREVCDAGRLANTFQLAASAYGVSEVTDAQIVATRRALRKLAKAGRVFEMTGYRDGKVWGNERYGVYCRIRVLLSHDDIPFFTDDQIARHEAEKGGAIGESREARR